MKKLGEIVRQRREELGKLQEDLARELGVHYNTISRWELTGKIPPRRLAPLAQALDIDVTLLRQTAGLIEPATSTKQHDGRVQARGYVKSDETITAWRNQVALDRSLDNYTCLLLMALPVFLDRTSWIVSVTTEAFVERTHLNRDQVITHWKEMIASPYVERIGDAEWALRLTFPES